MNVVNLGKPKAYTVRAYVKVRGKDAYRKRTEAELQEAARRAEFKEAKQIADAARRARCKSSAAG
jgi:hypothetical protein